MKRKALIAADIAECALFVALMVASAFISIPFPLVPLTFQTAVAILCGLLLGWKKGIISMTAYMVAGLIGIPVFAAGGGIYYVLKPSFGYILGFIAAAGVGGAICGGKTSFFRVCAAAIAAFAANYIIGIPYCIVAAHLSGVGNLVNLLIVGNLVYMPKDFALALIAAVVASKVAPAIKRFSRRSR